MLMTKERRPAIRTLRGWATSVLQEVGANLVRAKARFDHPVCCCSLWTHKCRVHDATILS